jgi:uncharacterized protein YdaU (DUF1376 family)
MKLWIGEFVSSTVGLTAAETGAYILLASAYFQNGRLPDSDDRRRKIARVSADEWSAVSEAVRSPGLFNEDWSHDRLDEEIADVTARTAKLSAGGRKGGRVRATRDAERRRSEADVDDDTGPESIDDYVGAPPRFEDVAESDLPF